ncbi:MAG: hypothetical protein QXQ02_02760, partial [Halobacteria archaeon]
KVRKEARRYSLIGKVLSLDDSECKCEVAEKQQNISFLDQLNAIISEEAKIVLGLLLNSQEKDYKNKTFIALQVRYELYSKGWSIEQVDRCFDEIQSAL